MSGNPAQLVHFYTVDVPSFFFFGYSLIEKVLITSFTVKQVLQRSI